MLKSLTSTRQEREKGVGRKRKINVGAEKEKERFCPKVSDMIDQRSNQVNATETDQKVLLCIVTFHSTYKTKIVSGWF